MSAPRVLALLAALAGASPAQAFVRSATDTGLPLFWPSPFVSYFVNGAPPQLSSPTCLGAQGEDPALDAVRAGFGAWQQPCSHLRLEYAGPTEEIRTGILAQERNVVVVRRGFCADDPAARADPCFSDPGVDCGGIYNCFEGGRRTLALTSVLFRASTGRIVDADIEVVGWDGAGEAIGAGDPPHGWYFTCVDPGAASQCTRYGQADCYYADLQNTVTHEAGHFVGLRHVCDAGDEPDLPPCEVSHQPVTMYPLAAVGEIAKRSLEGDDVAGLCEAYPDDGGGGCGCGSGAPGAVELASLLALAALRIGRRRARRPPAP